MGETASGGQLYTECANKYLLAHCRHGGGVQQGAPPQQAAVSGYMDVPGGQQAGAHTVPASSGYMDVQPNAPHDAFQTVGGGDNSDGEDV